MTGGERTQTRNVYAVAALIALLLRQRNWRRPKRTVWTKGRIIFYEEGGGGLKILWGGPQFFPNLKRGGHVFFQSLLNIFLKKVCNIRNQSASCTTEPLFVSLSNTDLQRFCLIHKPHSSILKDLFINKILYTISRSMYLLREKSTGKEKTN